MPVSFWEENKKFTATKLKSLCCGNYLSYEVQRIIFLSTYFTYNVHLKIFQTEISISSWYAVVYVVVTTYFLKYPEINNIHNVDVGIKVVFYFFKVSRREQISFSFSSELNVYRIYRFFWKRSGKTNTLP